MKLCNPKAINNPKVLIDVKFKAKVKDVLDMQLEMPFIQLPIISYVNLGNIYARNQLKDTNFQL